METGAADILLRHLLRPTAFARMPQLPAGAFAGRTPPVIPW